jgi:hypothetical protein
MIQETLSLLFRVFDDQTISNVFKRMNVTRLDHFFFTCSRVRKALKSIAKKMGLKTKEITYVGIHNRKAEITERTLKFQFKRFYEEPIEIFKEFGNEI